MYQSAEKNHIFKATCLIDNFEITQWNNSHVFLKIKSKRSHELGYIYIYIYI
jgi:hypothetical protein